MVLLSKSFKQLSPLLKLHPINVINAVKSNNLIVRQMSHGPELMHITPTRWQWHKFKDLLHFYTMVGAIPLTVLVTLVNVFVGPATLTETPKDYVPKHWEYYRHPISRFIARYILNSPQQEYEKYLHFLYEEYEKGLLRQLEKDVRDKMAERGDYKAYYYVPVTAKYHRVTKESFEELQNLRGDN